MNLPAESNARPEAFVWPIRVYFEDTDTGGIVFYANYLKFFERARTEWLRACGIEQSTLSVTNGTMFVVRSTAVDYRAPARLDDEVEIRSVASRIGRASVDFDQEAWCAGTLLATGTIRVGCVDRATMKPAALPGGVLEALQTGPARSRADALR
ncbi:tol-pal system-associated acyl-CoA thioesterase [Pararobbsia silviterrae]|uniref:Tol-pal system-associated acyl-CoA thioesterase n=1 Tax=Pararobbsia silviterrae TaxID=1792498 RepID=A0A494Y3G6_9BURK|nr:tol-pal system-associated acyl-CoA thioesterase [Pararobbsia silviterrae]RKP56548.1 tol-pal system-associated acyl-CoA thioesterase [Pararobbsia silviterrae]